MSAQRPGAARQRILIANENQRHLDEITALVEASGHDVIARLVRADDVAAELAEHQPDMAMVAVGSRDEHALTLVDELATQSSCPIIIFLDEPDPDFVDKALGLGAFACISQADPDEVASQIAVALHRHDELASLRASFGRRMVVERAKGVLMERHGLEERQAFERLRDDARDHRATIVTVAVAILNGNL